MDTYSEVYIEYLAAWNEAFHVDAHSQKFATVKELVQDNSLFESHLVSKEFYREMDSGTTTQCTYCNVYCKTMESMKSHMNSQDHMVKVAAFKKVHHESGQQMVCDRCGIDIKENQKHECKFTKDNIWKTKPASLMDKLNRFK
jgi:hypothetical protein